MKINKKLIKELVDNLTEFNLTELEYQEGDQKIKVSSGVICGFGVKGYIMALEAIKDLIKK